MNNDTKSKNEYKKQIPVAALFFVSGGLLVIGNVLPYLGFLFYVGILVISYLLLKGYIFRTGMYAFVAPYFLILGFAVWNYVFPYYTGIILALLLAELFGRLLYKALIKMQNNKFDLFIFPISLFIFDFIFQKISLLSFMNMIPLLAPVYNHRLLLSTSSFFGAQMTLLIIVLLIFCIMKIIVHKKTFFNAVLIGIVCITCILLPNLYNLKSQSTINYSEKSIKIAVVQGSMPNNSSASIDYSEVISEKLLYYMKLLENRTADITVFPETVFGIYDTQSLVDQNYRDLLLDAAQKAGGTAVFTVIEGNSITKSKQERFLSAVLIHKGTIYNTTKKRNLVPFSESKRYSRGTEYEVYDTNYGRIGISICYDINSGTVEKLIRNGAEIILAPFNDSSFGEIYHNIYRYYPVIKAAEYSIPIAVANEDGISQIIDSYGRILAQIEYKDKARVEYEVILKNSNSLYMKIRIYVDLLSILVLLFFIFTVTFFSPKTNN